MNRETLIEIINGFARDGKVFSNEQDFQFELALALKNEAEIEEVKLEAASFPQGAWNVDDIRNGKLLSVDKAQKEYTDLIVKTTEELYYAIELKFKGADKPYLYNSRAFGNVAVLKHGAEYFNAYRFLNDVSRLERINGRLFANDIRIEKGYAVLLTNNSKYKESDFGGSEIWREYSLRGRQKAKHGLLRIRNSEEKYLSFEPLNLNGNYTFEWNDYKLESDAMLNDKAPGFSFLVVEVDPAGN